jgi:hypothetical protein
MPFFRRIIIFNSGVAVSALAFQVGVLYPWHHVLSDQLDSLSKEVRELKKIVDGPSFQAKLLSTQKADPLELERAKQDTLKLQIELAKAQGNEGQQC